MAAQVKATEIEEFSSSLICSLEYFVSAAFDIFIAFEIREFLSADEFCLDAFKSFQSSV